MKRLVDVLIFLILMVTAGVVVYFLMNRDKSSSTDETTQVVTQTTPGAALATLSDRQLQDLLPRPEELPSSVGTGLEANYYKNEMEDNYQSMRAAWPQSAERLKGIMNNYAWATNVGVYYNACPHEGDPNLSTVGVEISQLPSVESARAFIDDPAVRSYFSSLFFKHSDTTLVHGWYLTAASPTEGDCFDEEIMNYLIFDYGGLLITTQVNSKVGADPTLAISLLKQLVPPVLARVNKMAGGPLPATPTPSGPPVVATDNLTLDSLAGLMPTLESMQLADGPYVLNQPVSHTYTRDEFVTAYRNLNMTALADAIAQAGETHGMIGQEVRVWDTGDACPPILGQSLEIDMILFETPQGAADYLADEALQQAWLDTGMVTAFEPVADGMIVKGSMPGHHCGSMMVIEKRVTFNRLIITAAVNAYADQDEQELIDLATNMNELAIASMFLAGLQ